MGIHTEAVQKLYVAYFNRPADFGGLAHWEAVVAANNGSTAAVSAAFAASQEYKDTYAGKSTFEVVNTIYNNLFGRDAEPAALLFWGNALNNKAVTIDNAVTTIAGAAQGTDDTAYKNKVAAATAFSAALDTTPEILGYSGTAANNQAKTWLSTITTDASLTAATAPAALSSTINAIANTGLSAGGTTQNLTVGIDTLTGTAGNDTFVGLVNNVGGATGDLTTLTSLDTVNGGTGADTLVINALTDITGAPTVALNSVEVVTIRAAKAVTADISAWTGVEQFNVTEATGNVNVAAAATTNISANLKANGTSTTTVNGGKDVVVKASDVNAAAQTITVGNITAAKGTVSVESTGVAAVAGAAVTMGAISVTGGTTINVTQNATSSAAGLTVGTTTHTQGNIVVTGNASTTAVNVQQTAAATAVAGVATVAAVTETASVKFNALAAGQSFTVGGLTFTATKALTAAEVATAFSNLINGALPVAGDTQGSGVAANGIYTGVMTGWTSAAASADTVVFTSTAAGNVADLAVAAAFVAPATAAATVPTVTTTNGVAAAGKAAVAGVVAGQVLVADAASSIKTVSVDSYGAGSAVTGASTVLETLSLSNSASDFTVADSAATLALNLNKIGTGTTAAAITITSAPTTLNVKSTGANNTALTAATTETLNVSGTGTLSTGSAGLGGLKTIVVTETAGLNTGAGVLGAVTSVNTTGTTGTVTVALDGDIAAYTGGAGVDNVTIDNTATTAISKAINLGAGDDRLNLTGLDAAKLGATGEVVMMGGEGTDTLAVNAAAAVTASLTAAFEGKFDGFERLEVGQLSASGTVNMDNMDAINYVISKGSVAGVGAAPTAPTATITPSSAGSAGTQEVATFSFADLADGTGLTIAGRTVTATGGVATAADIATAFRTGTTTNFATVSGTLDAAYTVGGAGTDAAFTSAAVGNPTDLSAIAVGAAAVPAPVVVQGTPAVAATNESASFTFTTLAAGESITVAGRTVTAGAAGASAADIATAFATGTTTGGATVSGTLANYNAAAGAGTAVTFTSTIAGDVANLTATTTGGPVAGTNVLTLDKMLANATVQFDAAGSVITKLTDVSGTADVVNLVTAAATGTVIGTATVAGVETININANDTVSGAGVSTNSLTVAADAAKTINVAGAGNLNLTLDAVTKVVTLVDGSTATGKLTIASSTAADAVAVTIKGGAAADMLTASGNKADVLEGGAGGDTLVAGSGLATLTGGAGNDLFKIGVASANVNSYATVTDFAAGDLIQFVGANAFTSAKVTLGETAVFQDYANAAINALSVGQIGWFTFGGNTYVVADMGDELVAGFNNGQDMIVKLTGTVDLTNASFNATYGTIGLV